MAPGALARPRLLRSTKRGAERKTGELGSGILGAFIIAVAHKGKKKDI